MDVNFKPSNNRVLSRKDYTKKQDEGINKALDWSNSNDYAPFVLSGFAGTGKTTMTKDIVRNLNGITACTAPTHKAARVASHHIGKEAVTIQKLLGLRPNIELETFDVNNPQFDPIANVAIKNYKTILIDECSMINKGLFELLTTEAERYGVNLLFVGDPYQLPPINEDYSLTFTVKYKHELTEIVRQANDNPLIELLTYARDSVKYNSNNIIRVLEKGRSKFTDDECGYLIADDTHFIQLLHDKFDCPEFDSNINYCRYAAFTNDSVSGMNQYVRGHLFGSNNRVLIHDDLLTSYTTIMDEFNSPIIYNSEDYIVHEMMDYNNKYKIKGFLVKLRSISTGKITRNMFIVDHADVENINRYTVMFKSLIASAKSARNIVTRRNAWEKFYEFKNYNLLLADVYDGYRKLIGKDLDYGFGLTVHKTQGSTFDNIFINASNIIYNKNGNPYRDTKLRNRLLYVALSRASNGAYILY